MRQKGDQVRRKNRRVKETRRDEKRPVEKTEEQKRGVEKGPAVCPLTEFPQRLQAHHLASFTTALPPYASSVHHTRQIRSKRASLERKCSDGIDQILTLMEQRLHNGASPTDLWDKTISFFTPKKTLLFHNGYSKYSRETLRLFPDSAEDVAPLCVQ
ncbi:hypothetical protein DNTS_009152 [Danionella cerebrum]|uniref:Uncharacterized protein n=1 Tax=Danionella cerebrum TaxID=2873325 RepID=A0A553QAW2_9TELE|nr:hypothetical protein DNTS_009152 [Danionella translucida]